MTHNKILFILYNQSKQCIGLAEAITSKPRKYNFNRSCIEVLSGRGGIKSMHQLESLIKLVK